MKAFNNSRRKYVLLLTALFSLSLIIHSAEGRGKTYDDLDEILKKEGLNSTKTHVEHKEVIDQGSHIDPNKVVHKPPAQIAEEKAVTLGVVIPKAYTASSPSARSSSTKTYENRAKKSSGGGNSDEQQSLPLKYLRIPKRDKDA